MMTVDRKEGPWARLDLCDLCASPLNLEWTRFTAQQIQSAVRRGLRPESHAIEVGAAYGMSKELTEEGWVERVMNNHTDWLLCPICVARQHRLLEPRRWWQFWR
jgi:hypothetical protein